MVEFSIATLVDSSLIPEGAENIETNNLDYENYGSMQEDFKNLRKREQKAIAKDF